MKATEQLLLGLVVVFALLAGAALYLHSAALTGAAAFTVIVIAVIAHAANEQMERELAQSAPMSDTCVCSRCGSRSDDATPLIVALHMAYRYGLRDWYWLPKSKSLQLSFENGSKVVVPTTCLNCAASVVIVQGTFPVSRNA